MRSRARALQVIALALDPASEDRSLERPEQAGLGLSLCQRIELELPDLAPSSVLET